MSNYYNQNQQFLEADYDVSDSIPTSFILSNNLDSSAFYQFKQRFKEIEAGNLRSEKMPDKHFEKNIWLVKPN